MSSKLFLDFDGVIFDTAFEAYLVSLITLELADGLPSAKSLEASDVYGYNWFLSHRHKIGPAWNYYYLFDARKSDQFPIFPAMPDESAVNFQREFFSVRQKLRESNFNEWLGLNRPYEHTEYFVSLLEKYPEAVSVVTTKDRETVETLLRLHGLRQPLNIYASDAFDFHGTKASIIQKVFDQESIGKAVFVDDCKSHIDACLGIYGLECVQARWGYVEPNIMENNFPEVKEVIETNLGLKVV